METDRLDVAMSRSFSLLRTDAVRGLTPDRRTGSDAGKLRERIEVAVSRVQEKAMLKHKRCDPQVVRGDRSALSPKLKVNPGIVMGCVFVCE